MIHPPRFYVNSSYTMVSSCVMASGIPGYGYVHPPRHTFCNYFRTCTVMMPYRQARTGNINPYVCW